MYIRLTCWWSLASAVTSAVTAAVATAAVAAFAGKGQYQQLPFGEVLQRLQDGDSSLYVTTQRIPSDKYGQNLLLFSPVSGSCSNTALVPSLRCACSLCYFSRVHNCRLF